MKITPFPSKEKLKALMQEKKIPGISMAIIENGKIAFQFEWGVKNAQTKDPIDPDTLFEVASLSKPVFAYGVLKLAEKDQLDLDKPLVTYFSYPDIQGEERASSITARMVLTHTCGFLNWRPKNKPLKTHFQPGQRFSYSGEGFLYLQRVIEHLSGLSLEEYMKKEVFVPLEMDHSTFIWVDDSRKALGHDLNGSVIEIRTEPPNAAFTLHTNALDYAKFVLAIFKEKGLKPETFKEMLHSYVQVPQGSAHSIAKHADQLSDCVSWGLGWGLQKTTMGDAFWHWGDNKGVKCFVIGFKAQQKAMIMLTNGSNGLQLIPEVIQDYLDVRLPAFDWLNSVYSVK